MRCAFSPCTNFQQQAYNSGHFHFSRNAPHNGFTPVLQKNWTQSFMACWHLFGQMLTFHLGTQSEAFHALFMFVSHVPQLWSWCHGLCWVLILIILVVRTPAKSTSRAPSDRGFPPLSPETSYIVSWLQVTGIYKSSIIPQRKLLWGQWKVAMWQRKVGENIVGAT